MIKWFKSRGFTDRLYFLNLILAWLYLQECVVITLLSSKLSLTDLSIISVGVPAVFAEVAVFSGYMVWKAKSENMRKFNKDNITM